MSTDQIASAVERRREGVPSTTALGPRNSRTQRLRKNDNLRSPQITAKNGTKRMEDRVRFALEKLLNIAHADTGQARRVANFLLAWWNADANGGFDIADLFAVDRAVSEDMVTVFTYLARGDGAVYPTDYRGEIEAIIKRWRPQTDD
jgi:hypothetical protein